MREEEEDTSHETRISDLHHDFELTRCSQGWYCPVFASNRYHPSFSWVILKQSSSFVNLLVLLVQKKEGYENNRKKEVVLHYMVSKNFRENETTEEKKERIFLVFIFFCRSTRVVVVYVPVPVCTYRYDETRTLPTVRIVPRVCFCPRASYR